MTKTISDFENEENVKLPTSYKGLLTVFNLNDLTLHYFNEEENFNFRLTKYVKWTRSNFEVYIDTFIERNELIVQWYKYLRLRKSKDFLPIGYTSKPMHGTLLLNMQPDKLGEVWIHSSHDNKIFNLDFLDNDILTFIDHCEVVKTDNFERLKPKLYKRMGEDFWRLG